jgi:hypothetical protein
MGNNQWLYIHLVLERMVWQLVVNGSMGKQKKISGTGVF